MSLIGGHGDLSMVINATIEAFFSRHVLVKIAKRTRQCLKTSDKN